MGLTCASFHVRDRTSREVREAVRALLGDDDVVAFISPARRRWVAVVAALDVVEPLAAGVARRLDAWVFSVGVFESDVLGYTLRQGPSVLDTFVSRGEGASPSQGRVDAFAPLLGPAGLADWAKLVDRHVTWTLEDARLAGMADVLGLAEVTVSHDDLLGGEGPRSFRRVGPPTPEERRNAEVEAELRAWRRAARDDGVLVAEADDVWLRDATEAGFVVADLRGAHTWQPPWDERTPRGTEDTTLGAYRVEGQRRLTSLEHRATGVVWTAEDLHHPTDLEPHPREGALVARCGANQSAALLVRGTTMGLLIPDGRKPVALPAWAKDPVVEATWVQDGAWLVVRCERSLRLFFWDRVRLEDGGVSAPDVQLPGWFTGVTEGPDGGLLVATGTGTLALLSLPDGRLGPALARFPLGAVPRVLRRTGDGRFVAWGTHRLVRSGRGTTSHTFVVDAARLLAPDERPRWAGVLPARDRIAELVDALGDDATDVLMLVAQRPFASGAAQRDLDAWKERFGPMPPALELLARLWEGGSGDLAFLLAPLRDHAWAADGVRVGFAGLLPACVVPGTGEVRAGRATYASLPAFLRAVGGRG